MKFAIRAEHTDNQPDTTHVEIELDGVDIGKLVQGEEVVLMVQPDEGSPLRVSVVAKLRGFRK